MRDPRAVRLPGGAGEFTGQAESGDLMRGQRSGSQTRLLTAAKHQRRQGRLAARAHEQRADALRAVDLVRRQRQQVHRQPRQIQRQPPDALRGIDMKHHRAFPAHLTDGLDVLDHARLIVDVHQGHQRRIGAQGRGDGARTDPAVGVRLQPGDA